MVFIEDISNKILNTYNDNIIRFKATNTSKTVSHSEISINGIKDELTPNLNDEFRYNFLQIAKVLNNLNSFKDELNFNGIIHHDTGLYHELNVDIKIIFSDQTEEKETKKYKFLKSVEQVSGQKRIVDYRLFPLAGHKLSFCYLTYFEGYPYDIPFYSDADREIKVYHKKTQHEIKLKAKKGVNRLIVSNGKSNISLNDVLPLYIGHNELEFKINNEVLFTVMLKKEDTQCGIYLKWFNQSGAFSYWLFPRHSKNELKPKTINNLEYSYDGLKVTGKNGFRELHTESRLLSSHEYHYTEELFLSPRVQMLDVDMWQLNSKTNWIDVRILDRATSNKTQHERRRIPVNILFPKLKTQTL